MRKINFFLLSIVILLSVFLCILWNINNSKQKKIDILSINQSALLSDIKIYKDKNGQLVSLVNGLTVDKSTFKTLNDSLYTEVSKLKLKLKNVSSVTEIKETIKYLNGDTIYSTKRDSISRVFYINETYINMQLSVTHDSIINPKDFSIRLPNKQIIVLEGARYKGWWFWRKLVGARLHVKNSNPYYEIEDAQYFDFTKIK